MPRNIKNARITQTPRKTQPIRLLFPKTAISAISTIKAKQALTVNLTEYPSMDPFFSLLELDLTSTYRLFNNVSFCYLAKTL
jgi:hypothetical protein